MRNMWQIKNDEYALIDFGGQYHDNYKFEITHKWKQYKMIINWEIKYNQKNTIKQKQNEFIHFIIIIALKMLIWYLFLKIYS